VKQNEDLLRISRDMMSRQPCLELRHRGDALVWYDQNSSQPHRRDNLGLSCIRMSE